MSCDLAGRTKDATANGVANNDGIPKPTPRMRSRCPFSRMGDRRGSDKGMGPSGNMFR